MVLMIERKKVGISSSKRVVGLSIVQQIYESESNNIVVKYGLRSLTRTPIISSSLAIESNITIDSTTNGNDEDYCFLSSCHSCQKHLRTDKDIYMYRGDQGFCSLECRNKQIMVDEMKEREAKYKRRNAISTMDCRGCETCKLLQELRQSRHQRTKLLQPQPPLLSIS